MKSVNIKPHSLPDPDHSNFEFEYSINTDHFELNYSYYIETMKLNCEPQQCEIFFRMKFEIHQQKSKEGLNSYSSIIRYDVEIYLKTKH